MVQILIAMGASLTAENANGYEFHVSSVPLIFKMYYFYTAHFAWHVLCYI